MIVRNKNGPDELPLRPMLLILIVVVLAPLLIANVLTAARYYKSFTTSPVSLGVTIFKTAPMNRQHSLQLPAGSMWNLWYVAS